MAGVASLGAFRADRGQILEITDHGETAEGGVGEHPHINGKAAGETFTVLKAREAIVRAGDAAPGVLILGEPDWALVVAEFIFSKIVFIQARAALSVRAAR